METFSALLALCVGNSPMTGEFPSQRPGTRSFDVFFDLCLNKRLSKQSWGWWFETPSLWRHYKNIKRHTAHTIVLWPNPKQWIIVHTSDLMMIIRQSNIFSQPSRGNWFIVYLHNHNGRYTPRQKGSQYPPRKRLKFPTGQVKLFCIDLQQVSCPQSTVKSLI